MAIFKAPRITSEQRITILLQASEIVYDTDEQLFYGGNGIDFGGFRIGKGSGITVYNYTLLASDIDNKFIDLPFEPFSPSSVRLNIAGGIEQVNGIDFSVTGDVLSWDGLGLDNFLEEGDTLIIQL
jgi:hypothetical protein